MRIWDIPVKQLCNKHLIAQHHEIHCIASIINKKKHNLYTGFANHPEVLRWEILKEWQLSLSSVHEKTIEEMSKRGIRHNDNNDSSGIHIWKFIVGYPDIPELWQSKETQIELLKSKNCECKV